MKVHKPYSLFVPTDIKKSLERCILVQPPTFRYEMIDFYFIIHYMLNKQIYAKKESNGFSTINKKYLKTVIDRNADNYIKYLKFGEFIISDNDAKPGKKKLFYKLNPKFALNLNKIEVSPQTKLFERIHKRQRTRKAHYNRLDYHLKVMKEYFVNVQFDLNRAMGYISALSCKRTQLIYAMQVFPFEDKRLLYFKRSKTNGRLNTNLTNLKRELRNFLIGDFVSIDLKNSQPFFLNQLLQHIITKTQYTNNNTLLCHQFLNFDIVKEFGIKAVKQVLKIHQNQKKSNLVNLNTFSESVNSGWLYEFIAKHFKGKYSRDDIKEKMFGILFSQNVVYNDYKKIIPYRKDKQEFRTVFPFETEATEILKSKDHKTLPVFLQKTESYIFIDCIAKELVNAGIVPLTIHDSVIVESIHQNKAIEIINKTFNTYFNVVPRFHVKQLKSKNNEYKKAV
ncbi:MAG: hypothetical protein ACQETJ_11450 [Bacteroidota bacterium]